MNKQAKPFLKWAGGKTQLLEEIRERYPKELGKNINKYAEPFVGGGAVLFDILSNYEMREVYISDINEELINIYITIRDNIEELLISLNQMQNEFIPLEQDDRKEYFYLKRERFNEIKDNKDSLHNIEKASLFIFLNRTCFNGLYRVNKKGYFNVPMGAYKNPKICDEENLRIVSKSLKNVSIIYGDYKKSESFIDENTFVYIDPPYRPLNDTSSFTSYTENDFNDEAQKELSDYIRMIDKKGAKILASNSDPKNTNPEDDFFEVIYKGFKIDRVEASRMINSKSKGRGKIKELLISNF